MLHPAPCSKYSLTLRNGFPAALPYPLPDRKTISRPCLWTRRSSVPSVPCSQASGLLGQLAANSFRHNDPRAWAGNAETYAYYLCQVRTLAGKNPLHPANPRSRLSRPVARRTKEYYNTVPLPRNGTKESNNARNKYIRKRNGAWQSS